MASATTISPCRVVYVTCSTQKEALHISQTLVEARLAACVNILPGITSVYRWEGQVQKDQECLLVIKTTEKRLAELQEKVLSLHSYTVSEIIALPVLSGNPTYLAWLEESVAESPS